MGKTRQLGDLVNIIGTDGAGSVILPTLPTVPSIEMVVFNPDHTISTQPINITTTLSALTDVSLISPVPGQVLTFDGLKWINANATGGSGNLPVGGTAGQILAKIDATNYNTTWIDNFTSQVKHEVKLGANLAKGTPVYVSGSTGGSGTNMIVSAASNASEATSSKTMGLLQSGGVTNDFVYVITEGLLAGLDTSAANAVGDPVWLGPTGTLLYGLANKPVAPIHMVFIGIVTRIQSNNGEIFVKVQNGFEIEELHNVLFTSKADKDLMYYDNATSLWKNAQLSTILGYTPISGTGVAGQITYWSGTSAVTGSSNLVWDNTNARLGIGTSSPGYGLSVIGTTSLGTNTPLFSANHFIQGITDIPVLVVRSLAGGGNSDLQQWYAGNNKQAYLNSSGDFYVGRVRAIGGGPSYPTIGFNANSQAGFYYSSGVSIATTNTERMKIYEGTGNVVMQNGGTFTDGGQRLQVIGDAFIKGSGNTSATNALLVQNSDGTSILKIGNDRTVTIGLAGGAMIVNTNSTTLDRMTFQVVRDGVNPNFFVSNAFGQNASGTYNIVSTPAHFQPTSGTAVYNTLVVNPTVNQTGGANGITRGLYVAPTLTAAADFRAIETTAGNVLFGSNFFWDNTNGRLGIGTSTLLGTLNIRTNTATSSAPPMYFSGTSNSITLNQDYGVITLENRSTTTGTYSAIVFTGGTNQYGFAGVYGILGSNTSALNWNGDLVFGTRNSNTFDQRLRIYSNGNLIIQNGGTFTDNGQRLQVNGDAAIISATSTGITTTTNVHTFAVANIKAVHYDYYIQNTVNGGWRTGVVMAVTNGTNVEFTDTATNDLTATTAGLTWSVSVISTNIVLTATITSGTWNIKVGTRML